MAMKLSNSHFAPKIDYLKWACNKFTASIVITIVSPLKISDEKFV